MLVKIAWNLINSSYRGEMKLFAGYIVFERDHHVDSILLWFDIEFHEQF